jgi:branched-chain amino acid transport system ATP-binding protein
MKPSVLLLDEPAAGVPEAERQDILDTVAALPRRRVGAADRARHGPGVQLRRRMTVLVNGAVLTEGSPERSPTIRG